MKERETRECFRAVTPDPGCRRDKRQGYGTIRRRDAAPLYFPISLIPLGLSSTHRTPPCRSREIGEDKSVPPERNPMKWQHPILFFVGLCATPTSLETRRAWDCCATVPDCVKTHRVPRDGPLPTGDRMGHGTHHRDRSHIAVTEYQVKMTEERVAAWTISIYSVLADQRTSQ